MSKKAIAAAGLAFLATMVAAQAADIPGISRPYAAPAPAYAAYNWMGPYIGANLGYEWGGVTNDRSDPSGAALGAQVGYNLQSGQFVLGVETDLQWANADDKADTKKFSNSWFGTSRARVGYAMNNILLYGTGGLAYGGLEMAVSGTSQSRNALGWTIGAGAEVGMTPNWTARIEYLYFNLGSHRYFDGSTHALDSSVMRAGVNYRF